MISAEEARALVDYDPFTGVMRWRPRSNLKPKAGSWNDRNAGNAITVLDSKGYICVQIYKKKYRAHRVAWLISYGVWPSMDVDHINRNKADNRLENLREATVPQNGWNVEVTSRNTSGVRGVFWHRGAKKWQAGICVNRKEIYLGLFPEMDAAVNARKIAEVKYYGEFAVAEAA